MANDKKFKFDAKGRFPGGFFLLLFIAVVILMTIHSLTSDRLAKVSFSHQVEHLINLNLTIPDENYKIAQNENLVTFSGKFRDRKTEEGEQRFKYLELLNRKHELTAQKDQLTEHLDELQKSVTEASTLFLHLTGQVLPSSGYPVIGSIYDTPDRNNSVVIRSLGNKNVPNWAGVQKIALLAQQTPNAETIDEWGKSLRTLVALFRSPALGIGSEPIKLELKGLEQDLSGVAGQPLDQQVSLYRLTMTRLATLITNLGREQDGARLSDLRSVRTYISELQQYNEVSQELEKDASLLNKARQKIANTVWYFNNQELSTRNLEKQDPELFGQWFALAKQEWEAFSANKGLIYRAPDQPRNTVLERTFKSQEPSPNYFSYILTVMPILGICFFVYFILSRQIKGVGSSAMNFGKAPTKLMTQENNKFTFKDVAGCEEAKEELKEIVDFLKDPSKFTALGARIPKGVLLVGSPGTGKTLIAKAVAGEADRPFFSISGSDFVEMFVGVGASRIRNLFEEARKQAPCIIFMDEIDAVGRHRGSSGIGGGHDEREQTLNQLLVEMDGFATKEGVILMAATNRPDILDRALLRPGRFDRRVVLDLPDVKGRYAILKVHARRIKIDASVDLMEIAKMTPGSSGADLENILNEAALLAARNGRSAVTSVETKEACDKVRFGKERRSLEMDESEKKTTAFHEAGHAIVSLLVEHSDPVEKVTIIPRGFSLGATHFTPKKNRLSFWKKEAIDQLAVLMGGRAAEEIFVGDMSSGARQDITQATKIARSMVCEWGMSDDLGTVSYDEKSENGQYLGVSTYDRNYSEETAKKIDAAIYNLIGAAHKRAVDILNDRPEKVTLMANMLMEFETLDAEDIKEIMEERWNADVKKSRLKAADELNRMPPPPSSAPIIQTDMPSPETGMQPG